MQKDLAFPSSSPSHRAHPRQRSKATAHSERGQAAGATCAAAELYCIFQPLRIWSEDALHRGHEEPHTWSQQRGGSAKECQDNVAGAQASSPQPDRVNVLPANNPTGQERAKRPTVSLQIVLASATDSISPCNEVLVGTMWLLRPPVPSPHAWKSYVLLLGAKVPCSSPQIFKADGT